MDKKTYCIHEKVPGAWRLIDINKKKGVVVYKIGGRKNKHAKAKARMILSCVHHKGDEPTQTKKGSEYRTEILGGLKLKIFDTGLIICDYKPADPDAQYNKL